MIKHLKWDSEHFGFNIADLKITTSLKNLRYVEDYARSNAINFVQTLCDVSDTNTINLLEKHGFYFADMRVNYILKSNFSEYGSGDFLMAGSDDITALRKIAKHLVANSRYYNNGFEREKIEKLYEIWVEKSICGMFDSLCLKETDGSCPVGFVTVKFNDWKNAVIGIIGVDANYQRKGVGSKLMNSLFKVVHDRGFETIEVATQGRNISAQNFYIKNGFRVKNVQSWYYKFFNQ